MMSAAVPRASAARASPSAAMILARFSRSASAWRAMARFMLSGSWMSLSSTTVTFTPPLLGLDVEDLADVLVDRVRLGQRLVERVPADHSAQGGLSDLIDRGSDVLDG